jgi:hypothetical protein
MWTFRNGVAFGLFLFGTTFLWMTPAMAGTRCARLGHAAPVTRDPRVRVPWARRPVADKRGSVIDSRSMCREGSVPVLDEG